MQQNKAQQIQWYFAHKYAYGCCHVLVSLYYKSWWIQVIPSVGEVILNGICKINCHLKATSESANRIHNYFVFAISWYQWNVSVTPIQPLQRINLISVMAATDVGIRSQLITKCLDVSIPGTNGQRRNTWYLATATELFDGNFMNGFCGLQRPIRLSNTFTCCLRIYIPRQFCWLQRPIRLFNIFARFFKIMYPKAIGSVQRIKAKCHNEKYMWYHKGCYYIYNNQFCRRPPDYDEYDIIIFASGNTGI